MIKFTFLVQKGKSMIVMRKYKPADKSSLITLWQNTFPNPEPHNEPSQMLDSKLKVDRLLFVAELYGQVIGSCIAGYDGHRGWLYTVAISPELRRKSIGSKLVKHTISELQKLGCVKINLQIGTENKPLTIFYQSLGFSIEPRTSMGMLINR